MLCVLGGPEFPSGTGQLNLSQTSDLCLINLLERPSVDYYCYSDGEKAVVRIVQAFIDADCSVENLKRLEQPLEGAVTVKPGTQEFIVGGAQLQIGLGVKNGGRDTVPSSYLSGMMENS